MQLAESSIALSVSGSEHVRQLAGVQEHMTEVGKYNDLEAELVATQQRLSESEALAEQRAAETNKLLISKLHDALNHLSVVDLVTGLLQNTTSCVSWIFYYYLSWN